MGKGRGEEEEYTRSNLVVIRLMAGSDQVARGVMVTLTF